MISKQEFEERLTRNVITGKLWIVFTPLSVINIFSNNKKYFYGTYAGNSFSLTKNSFFSPIPFTMKGHYELAEDGQAANVTYKVKPLFLSFFVSRLVLFLTLIIIFSEFFLLDDILLNFERLITPVAIVGAYTLLLIVISKRKKEELEEIFRSVFVFT
ncbi:MAG: hypothetical protein AAFO69_19035 [Bacteroidota bacterium]